MKPNRSISVLLALSILALCAGCLDQADQEPESIRESPHESLGVTITSPSTGTIFSGDEKIIFDSTVKDGQKPYTYAWSSALGGTLSKEKSFKTRSSEIDKGTYVIVLRVADSSGREEQASITITVL